MGFQFSSLVFGFIRNKDDKNKFRVGGEQFSNNGEIRSEVRMESELERNSALERSGEASFVVNAN